MSTTEQRPSSAAGRALPDVDVDAVIQVIDNWAGGQLSWPSVAKAVERQTGKRYSRVALQRHKRVQLAFAIKTATMLERPTGKSRLESELATAKERIAKQEMAIARLLLENCRLREQVRRQLGLN
ncbi:hypothetical protein OOT46_21870 [Aquabacterium sp. A7-Y]|uniref:hypothetical protein n=1 Tax=Aquabacterium sp. A7-Y TaxID=1349605 RepID=UPI00223D83A7|nr:hypothetical protein [Aquabacterium sp. A7-Y]MCW7540475.1 hypothetical protein [Aquabacterium sp. A7-Y]